MLTPKLRSIRIYTFRCPFQSFLQLLILRQCYHEKCLMDVRMFATTKLALVHEYREVSESDRAYHIEQTLQKRILEEIGAGSNFERLRPFEGETS